MLSDTDNIPPPASSPDSSSDDNSPPSFFITATTIVNSITSMAALGIAIPGYVHNIRKDRRDSKKVKGKKKDEGVDLLQRVDEDMLLRITQLEQTVSRYTSKSWPALASEECERMGSVSVLIN